MPTTLDGEIAALAEVALCNAFLRRFLVLVGDCLSAGAGLNQDSMLQRMSEMTNVHGSTPTQDNQAAFDIQSHSNGEVERHTTLTEALAKTEATSIELNGRTVFERRPDIGWYYVEDMSL